ncbi:MAG: hypothetical protein HUK12_00855 [Muribaculaceae bacterium]|nr:hypothetical protein [Muribaculaceae bacterium]
MNEYKCDGCGETESEKSPLRCIVGYGYDWQLCPRCYKIFDNLEVLQILKKLSTKGKTMEEQNECLDQNNAGHPDKYRKEIGRLQEINAMLHKDRLQLAVADNEKAQQVDALRKAIASKDDLITELKSKLETGVKDESYPRPIGLDEVPEYEPCDALPEEDAAWIESDTASDCGAESDGDTPSGVHLREQCNHRKADIAFSLPIVALNKPSKFNRTYTKLELPHCVPVFGCQFSLDRHLANPTKPNEAYLPGQIGIAYPYRVGDTVKARVEIDCDCLDRDTIRVNHHVGYMSVFCNGSTVESESGGEIVLDATLQYLWLTTNAAQKCCDKFMHIDFERKRVNFYNEADSECVEYAAGCLPIFKKVHVCTAEDDSCDNINATPISDKEFKPLPEPELPANVQQVWDDFLRVHRWVHEDEIDLLEFYTKKGDEPKRQLEMREQQIRAMRDYLNCLKIRLMYEVNK